MHNTSHAWTTTARHEASESVTKTHDY